jgi:hypothetical protein
VRIERNPPVLRVLRVDTANDELVLRPVHVAVLDAQHLTLPAARFERPDDAVVHRRSHGLVLRRVHRCARAKERLLFVAVDAPVPFRFVFRLDGHTETMERRCCEQRRILESSPVDRRPKYAERAVHRRDFVAAGDIPL